MSTKPTARSGFTLLEALIALAVLSVVGVSFAASMRSMAALTTSGATRADVQRDGARALERILAELRSTGAVEVAGVEYPYLFTDGDADGDFAGHDHVVPPGVAEEGDYDFGPTREIVLVLPADVDGDREPDVGAGGQLVWSADEISYVLGTNAAGENVLERRVDGGDPEEIVAGVERVVFDDAESSGWVVPLDSLRVEIFFRATDGEGREVRYSVEGTTRMRNG